MTKSKTVEKMKAGNNIVTMEIQRREAKLGKKITHPADSSDKFEITYTEFAANQERTEILSGEGKEFENDTLLEVLGFEKDSKGVLVLQTEPIRDIEKEESEENELGA